MSRDIKKEDVLMLLDELREKVSNSHIIDFEYDLENGLKEGESPSGLIIKKWNGITRLSFKIETKDLTISEIMMPHELRGIK